MILRKASLKRIPNFEQGKAIDASGGVLLSAGAGSGKTFVIVEHLLKKIESYYFINKQSLKSSDHSFLSSIAVVSFSRKAAGELRERIYQRLAEIKEAGLSSKEASEAEKEFWRVIYRKRDKIFIGTIHGLSYRVLKTRGLPFELSSPLRLREKISRLYDSFLENYSSEEFFGRYFYRYKEEILDSLSEGNNDKKFEGSSELSFYQFFSRSPLWVFWERLYTFSSSLGFRPLPDNKGPSAFETGIENFRNFFDKFFEEGGKKEKANMDSLNFLRGSVQIFSNFRLPKKFLYLEKELDLKRNRERQKEYLGQLEKHYECFGELNAEALPSHEYQKLIQFISLNYYDSKEITYSDLENLFLKEDIEKSPYSYLIVDEFQDTSEEQYKIILSLAKEQENLFLVGDIKQAIYRFRGGDVDLFKRLSIEMPNVLELKINYRSLPKVLQFNNEFFSFLFPRSSFGMDAKEEDSFSILFRDQVPGENSLEGNVVQYELLISDQKKRLSRSELDRMEAFALAELLIKDSFSSAKSIGVLYRNLGPSRHLISYLQEHALSIGAQYKLNLKEGFWSSLLYYICQFLLLKEKEGFKEGFKEKQNLFTLQLRELLQIVRPGLVFDVKKLEDLFERSYEDLSFFGLKESFYKFSYSLGFAPHFYREEMSFLDELFFLAKNDPEKLLFNLEQGNYSWSESVMFELDSGENLSRISILTVHSSKGLEYDHVYLGGIYTNGVGRRKKDFFGKRSDAYSFEWEGKVYRSPGYLIEEEEEDLKDFSEFKRLLYVACTRARKGLFWISLKNEKLSDLSYGERSWISAFRAFKKDSSSSSFSTEGIVLAEREFESRGDLALHFNYSKAVSYFKERTHTELYLLKDLSVTAISKAAECPRKYYFSSVLGLAGDYGDSASYQNPVAVSSVNRGQIIHEEIEKFLKGKKSSENSGILQNLEGEILEFIHSDGHQLFSEKKYKWELFSQMIEGVADLLIRPKGGNGDTIIYDFKTGSRNREREKTYWMQLVLYASAELKDSDCDSVTLRLFYLDDEVGVTEKRFTRAEIEREIVSFWPSLNDFHQMNRLACEYCPYSRLC